MDHPFLLIFTCEQRWLAQFYEGIQDKINADAPNAAFLVDSGVSFRQHEGYLCILLTKKVSYAFKAAFLTWLQNDEDVLEVIKLPLSRLRPQLLSLFLQETKELQGQQDDNLPSSGM